MTMRRTMLQWVMAGTAALAVGWAPHARGSAFQLVEQNGSGLGNAYTGQAAAGEDPSAIFWNPAAMTMLPGVQASVSLVLVTPTTKFQDEGSKPGQLQPGVVLPGTTQGGNGGDAGGINYVPAAYLSWEIMPKFVWAGIGVNAPFGLKTEWDDGWVGRFHAIKSDVKDININPSLAVRINDWFSVGGGVNAQWLDATLSNAVNYSGIVAGAAAQAGLPVSAALGALATCPGATGGVNCEGVATVKGDSWTWGWNVGAMATVPSTRTRIGASYRSQVEHDVEGTVNFSNRPTFAGPLAPTLTAALGPRLADGGVKTKIKLPDWATVAFAQPLGDRLELLADFSFVHWNVLRDLSIYRSSGPLSGAGLTQTPLKFKNSWRAGVAANYKLTPGVKLRGGVSYDESPVKDEFRSPRLPDQDRLWVATGVQFAVAKAAAIDLGFAYLFVSEGRSSLGQPPPTADFPQQAPRGTLVGHYTDTAVWIAGAQAKYAF